MKLTSSVFVAQVREPPHISKAYDLSCNSQEELDFAGPLSSGLGAGCSGGRMGCVRIQHELDLWTERLLHHTETRGLNKIKNVTMFTG